MDGTVRGKKDLIAQKKNHSAFSAERGSGSVTVHQPFSEFSYSNSK